MKRILAGLFALSLVFAFLGGGAHTATSKEEKSPNPEKAPAVMKAMGIVTAFQARKMIKVKRPMDEEWTFDITGDTKVKGDVKAGAWVIVLYRKDGDKLVASSIVSRGGAKGASPGKGSEGNKGASPGKAWPEKARLDELNRPGKTSSSDDRR